MGRTAIAQRLGLAAPQLVIPLPPDRIPGTIAVRGRDAARLAWWVERGFLICARSPDSPLLAKAYYGTLSAAFWPLLPLAVTAQWLRDSRSWVRYYMSPERDAVIAVGPLNDAWYVEDHFSAQPGSGQGRALRKSVLPALSEAADAAGVAIEAIALTPGLAETYIAEMPGLVDLGRVRLRSRRLRREPVALGSPAA